MNVHWIQRCSIYATAQPYLFGILWETFSTTVFMESNLKDRQSGVNIKAVKRMYIWIYWGQKMEVTAIEHDQNILGLSLVRWDLHLVEKMALNGLWTELGWKYRAYVSQLVWRGLQVVTVLFLLHPPSMKVMRTERGGCIISEGSMWFVWIYFV